MHSKYSFIIRLHGRMPSQTRSLAFSIPVRGWPCPALLRMEGGEASGGGVDSMALLPFQGKAGFRRRSGRREGLKPDPLPPNLGFPFNFWAAFWLGWRL